MHNGGRAGPLWAKGADSTAAACLPSLVPSLVRSTKVKDSLWKPFLNKNAPFPSFSPRPSRDLCIRCPPSLASPSVPKADRGWSPFTMSGSVSVSAATGNTFSGDGRSGVSARKQALNVTPSVIPSEVVLKKMCKNRPLRRPRGQKFPACLPAMQATLPPFLPRSVGRF